MSKQMVCILVLLLALPWGTLPRAEAQSTLSCNTFSDASVEVRIGYYMGEGMGYFESGEPSKALLSFSCVTDQIDSGYVPGFMARAAVQTALREYDKAIADYTTAIGLDASYTGAYNNRGIVYAAQADYTQALSDFDQAIELDSGFVLAYTNRAVLRAIQGDFDASVGDLQQAISLSGIADVVADLSDPDRPADAPHPTYDRDYAQPYALLGIIYSAWALDNYNNYLLLTGSQGDIRIQSAAGALESRFTFDLRLDDGTWLLLADFSPAG